MEKPRENCHQASVTSRLKKFSSGTRTGYPTGASNCGGFFARRSRPGKLTGWVRRRRARNRNQLHSEAGECSISGGQVALLQSGIVGLACKRLRASIANNSHAGARAREDAQRKGEIKREKERKKERERERESQKILDRNVRTHVTRRNFESRACNRLQDPLGETSARILLVTLDNGASLRFSLRASIQPYGNSTTVSSGNESSLVLRWRET